MKLLINFQIAKNFIITVSYPTSAETIAEEWSHWEMQVADVHQWSSEVISHTWEEMCFSVNGGMHAVIGC